MSSFILGAIVGAVVITIVPIPYVTRAILDGWARLGASFKS